MAFALLSQADDPDFRRLSDSFSPRRQRGRSKSKIEVDLIQKLIEQKNMRDRIRKRQMENRVKDFCERLEEFKSEQLLRGFILSVPAVF